MSGKPRIGVAGLLHESNTFIARPTTREDFAANCLDFGEQVGQRWRGSHHEVGGFLQGAAACGFEPVPILLAIAVPAGPLSADTFDGLLGDMLDGIRAAGHLDALLLCLHGATVAANHPDADGEVVTRVRELVGPDLPMALTLDPHANISPRMIAGTDATLLYQTVPHTDQHRCGLEVAGLLARAARGEIRPVQALESLPLAMNVICQDTDSPPAATIMAAAAAVGQWPDMLSASVAFGFPQADVAEMGVSVVAVADGDDAVARTRARALAARLWEMREQFVGSAPGPEQAIRQAAAMDGQPVVVSDMGDNVGAGGVGDSTILLGEIMRQGVSNALLLLHDPQAVEGCLRAGVRSRVALEVGGKSDRLHGAPVALSGRVRTLSDGYFHEPEPRHGSWQNYNQGITAVVETDDEHTIVLTSRRMAPLSLHQLLSVGIDPARKKIIVVKAVIAPWPAYRAVTDRFILCNTAGATSADLTSYDYRNRRRPMFPLEPEATYP